jgi:hypothetical protein
MHLTVEESKFSSRSIIITEDFKILLNVSNPFQLSRSSKRNVNIAYPCTNHVTTVSMLMMYTHFKGYFMYGASIV